MSADFYGGIAGDLADGERDGDDIESPEEYAAAQAVAEEPPEDYPGAEAERYLQRHRDQDHGGRKCDCPVTGPEYADEPPF